MPRNKTIQVLLVLVVVLLVANLVRPVLQPTPVSAEAPPSATMAITGTGNVAWILKGNQIYYVTFEKQFESIRIYGPEEIEE